MNAYFFDFVTACLVMGVGIGTDVAIATVLRAKQLTSTRVALYWILGVSLTHTVFPMLGYLLTYFSIQANPVLTPLIGLLAFVLISHFLWSEFSEMHQEQNRDEKRQVIVSFALILAVSWDALWSGPAKSAQVVGWPELMIWGSFLLVGLMVTATSIVSWCIGRRLFTHSKQELSSVTKSAALWVQYSIIGYFGLLALVRYTLQLQVHWWQILLISALLTLFIMGWLSMTRTVKVNEVEVKS